jgi:hypothetical protein
MHFFSKFIPIKYSYVLYYHVYIYCNKLGKKVHLVGSYHANLHEFPFHETFHHSVLMDLKSVNMAMLVSYSSCFQYLRCEQMQSCCYLAMS